MDHISDVERLTLLLKHESLRKFEAQLLLAKAQIEQLQSEAKKTEAEYLKMLADIRNKYALTEADSINGETGLIVKANKDT